MTHAPIMMTNELKIINLFITTMTSHSKALISHSQRFGKSAPSSKILVQRNFIFMAQWWMVHAKSGIQSLFQ
jgi:hypothetical protein